MPSSFALSLSLEKKAFGKKLFFAILFPKKLSSAGKEKVYNWEKNTKMVGGDILQYWSKCLIELVNEGGKRAAFLRKHRSLPEKKLDFVIVNEGVKKRGWL